MEWKNKVSDILQLVTEAGNGSVDAMAKLYSLTLKPSYFLANELCTDENAAVEITEKAYARAFCNISKLKKPEAFELWMKQNIAVAYREGKRFVFADADADAGENSTEFLSESILDDEEKCKAVADAVSALKPELRAAVVLHYNNGMSIANLAKILGVSESTANALLAKARANILLWSGADKAEGEASNPVPVLTRIFQKKEAASNVPGSAVREIFAYAFKEYKASLVQSAEAPAVQEAPAEEKEQETEPAAPAEEEAPAEEASEEKEEDNVISFKQKISEILSQEPEAAEEEADAEESDAPEIPDISPISEEAESAIEVFSADMEKEEKSLAEENRKPKKLKLDIKKIAILCAAVIVVIVAIFGISAAVSNSKNKQKTPEASQSQSAEGVWKAGGFEECSEITYLNESVCYFKSKTTGKYGLMDYSGKVLLQPNYDGFMRCGNGRDYSGRDSYHICLELGGLNYEVKVTATGVIVAETPHTAHSLEVEKLDSKSYVERDRYFEGYAAAQNSKGKWGYVSQEKDKKVIPYEYEAVNSFDNMNACDYCRPVTGGLAAVKKNGKMGIINLKNDVVVPFEYNEIMPGKDGVFIAEKDGVWGVILTGNAQNTFGGINITVQNSPEIPSDISANPIGTYIVTREGGANVRSDAGSDYDLVGEISEGEKVDAYAKKTAENGNEWVCIKINNQYGWIAISTLSEAESSVG